MTNIPMTNLILFTKKYFECYGFENDSEVISFLQTNLDSIQGVYQIENDYRKIRKGGNNDRRLADDVLEAMLENTPISE